MKKSSKSFIAFTVLAMAILACSVLSPKTVNSQNTRQSTQEVISTAEATNTTEVISTPEVERPFELIGIWKVEDFHAPDNSWNISYPVYLQFTNKNQFVYHGVEAFNSNRPTDVSDIVYLNINDATFIKKFTDIPDNPEYLGKFQKWTWRFDNGDVLFTVYQILDSQDLALNDSTITALATGVKVH
jgi:hypothetical protein